jgi:hypothetical protein
LVHGADLVASAMADEEHLPRFSPPREMGMGQDAVAIPEQGTARSV